MKKIVINLSNRWLYTFILIGIIILLGIIVYALAPGSSGNPGHNIQDVGPPATCADGQVLQFINSTNNWGCVDDTDTRCDTSGTCSQVCIGADCQSSWPDVVTTDYCAGGTCGSLAINGDLSVTGNSNVGALLKLGSYSSLPTTCNAANKGSLMAWDDGSRICLMFCGRSGGGYIWTLLHCQ